VRRLIHLFKYEPYLKALSQPLADFILSHLALLKMEEGEQILERLNPSFLTAVPLSGRRQRQRGFNQSAELAKELAKKLSIPLLDGCLIKVKNTASQVELSEKERKENVKGAFLVKKSAGVKDQKIILIDDVYTTGSTMEECARVLKKAGAKQVWGIVVARG
jgi:ComF family protein